MFVCNSTVLEDKQPPIDMKTSQGVRFYYVIVSVFRL